MAQLTNIFHNDFYNRPTMPNWSWEVSILESSSEGEITTFTKAASKVEIPELQMLTTQTQFRGITFDIPTRLDNTGELTITFNENSELELYRMLKGYLLPTSFNHGYITDEYPTETGGKGMLQYVPFDIYVKLFDPRPELQQDSEKAIKYAFVFRNCFILDISDVDFAYDTEEVLEYTVKFHYNFRIEGNDADDFFAESI